MTGPVPMTLEDKLAADAFGKSYREFQELKPTHVRWSSLAPQAVGFLQEAQEFNWSMEKLGDYLHSDAAEAADCFRRFTMSKKVNAKDGSAERIQQAIYEWTARFGEDEQERRHWARELAFHLANQLHAAAGEGEELLKLSRDLENASQDSGGAVRDRLAPDGAGKDKPPEEPRKWGPQWKD